MTSYINLFLKTEVTCIPKLLKHYIGDYYNNALFNGATWVFVLWCVLHVLFDKLIDAFLKKLRYREYVRTRLKNSLWYLGFYGTTVVYSGATLAQNDVELFNFKKMHVPSSSSLPSQVMMGYTLVSTFFLHSSLWEGLGKEYFLNMFSYLFLFLFLVSSYILRIVEISFTLTTLIGLVQVGVEFVRCCFMSTTQDSILSKLFVGLLYFFIFSVCFSVYIIVIPLTFIIPLGLKIMSDYPNILLVFLFSNLLLWLLLEIYQSVLFKLIDHWFYHQTQTETDNLLHCSAGILECSLFKPRDDISYNLQIIKKEIKARQAKMMSMRKPKNKTMFIQTLKCMAAIKKKLSEKRKTESSDSDSDKSDECNKKTIENRNSVTDTGELLSDQDEETDDESQDSVIENKKSNQNNKRENDESDSEELLKSQESNSETEEYIEQKTESNSKQTNNENQESDNNNKDEKKCSSHCTVSHLEGADKVQTLEINVTARNTNIFLNEGDNAKEKIELIQNKDNDNNNSLLPALLPKDDNELLTNKKITVSEKEEAEEIKCDEENKEASYTGK